MTRLVCEPNMAAFLDMIAASEGTAGKGDDGYNIMVGGMRFISYADHPRRVIEVRPGLKSSAAGRYQLLARYFDPYKKLLGLHDFSPENQDAIAIQQIKESGAFGLIKDGEIKKAIAKVAHIWASLPGAGYGQHEQKYDFLMAAYTKARGVVA